MPTQADKIVLGIDPGRDKTGLALVNSRGKLVQIQVVPTKMVSKILPDLAAGAGILVIGDGTTSGTMQQLVRDLLPGKELVVIDETGSTEAARPLYWQENPPAGWHKLVPRGLLVPPGPMDGYAAAILALRFLKQVPLVPDHKS